MFALGCVLATGSSISMPVAAQDAPKDPQSVPAAPQGDKNGENKTPDLKPGATQSEIDAAVAARLTQIRGKKPAAWSAEELAEFVTFIYGGRYQLSKVYNSGREEGRITIATTNGELAGDYTRRFINGPAMAQDRVRLDIIFETSPKPENQLRYTLAYNGASVWAAQNGQYISPDGAASSAFKASIFNDYTALFRYYEDGSKLVRKDPIKIQGIDLDVIEMTRADGTKLTFLISSRTYRILHVDYEVVLAEGQLPVHFRESFSDFQALQQTLVPGKRKLRQNDQLVQTIELKNATYGSTFDDSVFLQLNN